MYVNSWETTTVDRICWHAAVSNEMAEPSYKQTSSTRPKDVLGMVSGPQGIPVEGCSCWFCTRTQVQVQNDLTHFLRNGGFILYVSLRRKAAYDSFLH